ncbi:MAG: acylphosphatase [Nitriliruptorales bacterium]|nr:acylphosphatase [Nitriliruptorales bacterium]
MTDVIARRVVFRGLVQGVWFRADTRDEARRRGVAGWIRNLPDGTVEAHLEGEEAAVFGLLDWIEEGGPSRARVTNVTVEDAVPTGHDDFDIVR